MQQEGTQRIDSLDALRGLAALSVVFLHILSVYPAIELASGSNVAAGLAVFVLSRTPLATLYAGSEAVLLFFVLSGFVLALPFFEGRAPGYPNFIVRRVCRIYLPCAAALIVALAARSMVRLEPVPGITPWLGDLWTTPPSWGTVAGYLAMTGLLEHRTIDFVVWSLIHEMRISLIFPLLIAMTRLGNPAVRLVLAGALSSCCAAVAHAGAGATPAVLVGYSLLQTGRYLWLFVLGIELARQRRRIAAWVAGWRPVTVALTFAISLCLYDVRFLFPQIDQLREWYLRDYLIGCGAAGFMVIALAGGRFAGWLQSRPLLMLGRISYSLYLFHPIVLLAMVYALHDRLPAALWLPAILPMSIATAWVMWRLIERPSIALGRSLTAGRRLLPLPRFETPRA